MPDSFEPIDLEHSEEDSVTLEELTAQVGGGYPEKTIIDSSGVESIEDLNLEPYFEGKMAMKPLERFYAQQERLNPLQERQVDGRPVQVRDKGWMPTVSTQYMDAEQRAEHSLNLRAELPDKPLGRVDPGLLRQAFAAQEQRINDLTRRMKALEGDEWRQDLYQTLKREADGLIELGEKEQVSAIFVMDSGRQFYGKGYNASLAQTDQEGDSVHVHHSSFLAGEAVAGAGEMVVDKDGVIKEISDRSGHYKPGEAQTTQVLKALQKSPVKHGPPMLNLENTRLTLERGTEKTTGMAKEYQAGGEENFLARHTVADEIKAEGKHVRELLDQGPAVGEDAVKEALSTALADAKTESASVRSQLGKSFSQRGGAGGHNAGPHV